MASVTTWQRLEPLPRTDDLRASLEAQVADPLWLLARQWQVGELRGEDAGTPIRAQLRASSARVSRYHPGAPGAGAAGRAVDYDDATLPLEAVVEREALGDAAGNARLAATAGLQFLRLLAANGAARQRAAYLKAYPLPEPPPGADPASHDFHRLVGRRALDGLRLLGDLRARRGTAAALSSLPARPAVPAAERPKVLAAANAWLARWEGTFTEPAGDDAWNPRRLEHAFAVQATGAEGPVTLHAAEYHGGHLDWYAFDARQGPDLGAPAAPRKPEAVLRTVLPTSVQYGGMPADRFWEVEDGSVAFGGLETGRTDLGRLVLAEFGLAYGNDWWVVPIDLPLGSLCSIDALEVTDTFGETTTVDAAADAGWRMFELSGARARRTRGLLFLPPVLAGSEQSEPVEEVAVLRDEMANVVWGVERRYQGPSGRAVDRYEEHQRRLAATEGQTITGDVGEAELVYRLSTFVPDHWIPFVPVRAEGTAVGSGITQLERRSIVRVAPDGTETVVEPRGRILQPGRPMRVEEEEVPRAGIVVRRAWQLARRPDGRTVVWSGRSKSVGSGEGSSGLRFDVAAEA